jgi:hypothetical protein
MVTLHLRPAPWRQTSSFVIACTRTTRKPATTRHRTHLIMNVRATTDPGPTAEESQRTPGPTSTPRVPTTRVRQEAKGDKGNVSGTHGSRTRPRPVACRVAHRPSGAGQRTRATWTCSCVVSTAAYSQPILAARRVAASGSDVTHAPHWLTAIATGIRYGITFANLYRHTYSTIEREDGTADIRDHLHYFSCAPSLDIQRREHTT